MSLSLSVVSASIGNVQQLAVDARTLHRTLEVKTDFSNWIKRRIAKFGFIEGEDFEKSSIISDSPILASQPAIEYTLSLDMAKELAMVENNERGRLVRRYFIECERKLREEQQKPRRKPRKALPKPEPRPIVDPFAPEPISLHDLTDALGGLAYRLELTCHNVTDEDWKAGAQRFYKAAGSNHNLTNMLSCTLIGPKFATLTLLRSACDMSHNALRMHDLVCSCR